MCFIVLQGHRAARPELVHTPSGCGLGLWGHNPMLAIPVDIVFLLAVLSECRSYPYFFSGVVSLTPEREVVAKSYPIQTVIQLLIGKTKKPIHRDIKNRREIFSRFKMMFYVTALKFKDGTVCSSIHSLTVPKSIECRWRYFLLAYRRHWAVLHRIPNRNILYLVVALFQKRFYYTKTLAENQVYGEVLYSFCKSRAYYFVTLSVERSIIGKYMLK